MPSLYLVLLFILSLDDGSYFIFLFFECIKTLRLRGWEAEVNNIYFLEMTYFLIDHWCVGLVQSSPLWAGFGLCCCFSYIWCTTVFKVPQWLTAATSYSVRSGVPEGFLQFSCPQTYQAHVCLWLSAEFLSAFLPLSSGKQALLYLRTIPRSGRFLLLTSFTFRLRQVLPVACVTEEISL